MTFKIKEGISIAGSQLSDGNRNLTAGSLIATGQTSLGGEAGSDSLRVLVRDSGVNALTIQGATLTNGPAVATSGPDANIPMNFRTKGSGLFRFSTSDQIGIDQFRVTHTASAVNFVQVTGAATGNDPIISTQGSDSNIGMIFALKGLPRARINAFGDLEAGIASSGGVGAFRAIPVFNQVNRTEVVGAIAGISPVLAAQGSDANISQVFRPKGTGAIDLAAGSSGVNISNGGTVTAITGTSTGSDYTSFPTPTVSAPTTAGGVQAVVAVVRMFNRGATVSSGGTGYTVGNVLTVVGGTPLSSAATLTVSTVSGGVITGVSATNQSTYTALPTNPVSVTGGTGSGATFNLTWGTLNGASGYSITNAGSGYVEQPTVSFSGGGGSGAAAYASVGSGTVIRSLGSTGAHSLDFFTPAGITTGLPGLRIRDIANADTFPMLQNSSFGSCNFIAQGNSNGSFGIYSAGAGTVDFGSDSTSLVKQFRITRTASAVNFVQVTGGATNSGPMISVQGSDSNAEFKYRTKGIFNHVFQNGSGASNFIINQTAGASVVNRLQVSGSLAGVAPSMASVGSDTNIDLALTPKGTGSVVSSSSVVPSVNNASDLGTSALQWREVFATKFTENGSPVVVQSDIGTEPNEIPLNQYLGNLAYQDAANIAGSLTAGSINNTPIGNTTAATATFTTLTATAGIGSTNTTTGTVIVTGGVGVSENLNIGGTATAATFIGALTGNAVTATALQTARTIGGVSFNGTANINLPGVNAQGNQNTTGSAATLTTARTLTIGSTGKTFNGSANVAWSLAEIGAQAAGNFVTVDTPQVITGTKTIRSSLLYQSPDQANTISSNMLDGGTLAYEGTAGQLFSITDSMTGTIFSVNDVSGIPSIEVLDSGLVKLAEYSGNVVIGSAVDNATDKLQVVGSAVITGQTELGGAGSSAGLRVLPLASSDNPWILTAGRAGVQGNRFSGLSPAIQSTDTGAVFFNTSAGTSGGVGSNQMRVSHTASAVNFVQVTGAATGSSVILSSQGSDANVGFQIRSRGTGDINLMTAGGNNQVVVRNSGNGTNFLGMRGSSAGNVVSIAAEGNDTNISQVFQSKGTGAVNLAAGSSGVNISNGNTVTAITRTALGSNYTSLPTVTISASTTAGGVQATATVSMLLASATIVSGGTGYTVGNVLTMVGGAGPDPSARINVTSVSGGVITGISINNNGVLTTLPTNPFAVTGGSGTGATFNGNFGVSTITVTNAGSGYVEQPTVSFSGGGGSGAAAYASVGSGTVIRSLGATGTQSLSLSTANGEAVRIRDIGGADSYIMIQPATSLINFVAQGGANANLNFNANGSGSVTFQTNGTSGLRQMAVAHTASAVNYLQVTGAATGGNVSIAGFGSDASIGFNYIARGGGVHRFLTGAGAHEHLRINPANAVNRFDIVGSVSGAAPVFSVTGTDTNIDLALTPKGTGAVLANGPLQVDTSLVIDSFTATTSSTAANQVIASISATVFRTAKFLIQAVNATGNRYHTTEILTIHNGTTADSTEYAAINIGGVCAAFTVDLSSGSIRLLATPATANSTVFTVAVHSLK